MFAFRSFRCLCVGGSLFRISLDILILPEHVPCQCVKAFWYHTNHVSNDFPEIPPMNISVSVSIHPTGHSRPFYLSPYCKLHSHIEINPHITIALLDVYAKTFRFRWYIFFRSISLRLWWRHRQLVAAIDLSMSRVSHTHTHAKCGRQRPRD